MANKDLVVKMTINSKDFDSGLQNAKSSMNSFDASIGKVTKSFGKVMAAVAAAKGVFELLEKTIKGTEQGADALGSSMYTLDSVSGKFFQHISSGQGSLLDFIKNLDTLRDNAKKAYAELDKLGTMKMWGDARIAQLRALITEDTSILNDQNATDEQKQKAKERISANTKRIDELSDNIVVQAENAAMAKLRELSGVKEGHQEYVKGVGYTRVGEGFVSDAMLLELVKRFEEVGGEGLLEEALAFQEDWSSKPKKKKQTGGLFESTNPDEEVEVRDDGLFKANRIWQTPNDRETFNAMYNLATVPEEKWKEYYDLLTEAATKREQAALQKRRSNRYTKEEGGTETTTPTTPIKKEDLTMTIDQLMQYLGRAFQYESFKPKTGELVEIGIPEEEIFEPETEALVAAVSARIKEATENIKRFRENAEMASTTLGAFADVFSGLSEIAADGSPWQQLTGALGGVLSEIAKLINTYASLVAIESVAESVKAGNGIPFPYNLVAIAAAGSALIGIIASLKSSAKDAGSFANGGIVGGNSYTGDRLIAHVNSGERILTPNQWDSLTSWRGGNVNFVIEGSQLRGVLDNYDKTTSL